jgi:glutamate synthase (NADPH/NADH) small chain
MRLSSPDGSGRQAPEEVPGSEFNLPADLVIMALGFDPEDLNGAFGESDLAISKWGTLTIDQRTMMTSLPGVFAAGDIVRGASLVVWAIKDGRDAADAMHTFLEAGAQVARTAAE